MKKVILLTVAVAMFIALPLGSVFAYEATTGPLGVLYWDSTKSYNGYTLFSPMSACKTAYLMDMEGFIVHEWQCDYTPGLHDVLLENGNILRGGAVDRAVTGCPIHFGGTSGIVQEIDWDGNVVWEYQNSDADSTQHHTFHRLPNGNTFILVWEYHSYEEAIAAGRTENLYGPEKPDQNGIWPDMVEEVNAAGQVVWKWHVWDHVGANDPAKFDINYALPLPIPAVGFQSYMGNADWTHFNTVGYLPADDLMIVNSRNIGEWYLIDHNTTTAEAAGPAGDILYRWGNPSAYGQGARPSFVNDGVQELFGPHCALPIDADCPGYGNILVFDNGWQRPEGNRSRSVEVDPTTDPLLSQFVWAYQTNKPTSFYTAYQGACQRLPNGNTHITSTGEGHIFEVTYGDSTATPAVKPEIVWDFINPVFSGVPVCQFKDDTTTGRNMVHRSHRYGPDFPGLAGRDLSQRWPFNPACPSGPALGYEPAASVPITGWGIPPGTTSEAGGAGEAGEGGGGGY